MQDQLGGIVAAVVGLAVLTIVASANMRGQEGAIQAKLAAAESSAVAFRTQLESDLRKIGDVDTVYRKSQGSVIALFDTASNPHALQFVGEVDGSDRPAVVRYEWSAAPPDQTVDETRSDDSDSKSGVVVRRFVDGRLSTEPAGSVTEFELSLLDSFGDQVSDLADTRQIGVRLHIVSPPRKGRQVDWVDWQGVVRPPALSDAGTN